LEVISADYSEEVTHAIESRPEEILSCGLAMEEITDFLSDDLVSSSIHMATINVDILIHIKRIGKIMNPNEIFSRLNFPSKGINHVPIRVIP
jgi:hypothetical protein